jgi:hypothetical protein
MTSRDDERDEWLDAPKPRDDRSTAIVAGAALEDCLEDAIKQQLVNNKALFNSFFKGMGPLATFAAKINMAVLLGIFDEESARPLHTIRRIRNDFAHSTRPLDFSSQHIAALCQNLMNATDFRLGLDDIRLHLKGKNTLGGREQLEELFVTFSVSDDSARTRYLGTVAFYVTIMELREKVWKLQISLEQDAQAPSHDKSDQPLPPAPRTGSRIRRRRASRPPSSPE